MLGAGDVTTVQDGNNTNILVDGDLLAVLSGYTGNVSFAAPAP